MFTLHDLRKQLAAARNPSRLQKLLMMMPGMAEIRKILTDPHTTRAIGQQIGVIDSMTVAERRNPTIINRHRIKGSGAYKYAPDPFITPFITRPDFRAVRLGSCSGMSCRNRTN